MDSCDRELFWELVGYVSKDPCEATGSFCCQCLPCRARENYEAHKKHLREADAVPKRRLVFAGVDMADGPDQTWVDLCQGVVDNFSKQFNDALELVLKEIGPERVSHILHPAPPNSPARRQIIGHNGELLGEVWVQWLDPRSDKREITVKGRYRAK